MQKETLKASQLRAELNSARKEAQANATRLRALGKDLADAHSRAGQAVARAREMELARNAAQRKLAELERRRGNLRAVEQKQAKIAAEAAAASGNTWVAAHGVPFNAAKREVVAQMARAARCLTRSAPK